MKFPLLIAFAGILLFAALITLNNAAVFGLQREPASSGTEAGFCWTCWLQSEGSKNQDQIQIMSNYVRTDAMLRAMKEQQLKENAEREKRMSKFDPSPVGPYSTGYKLPARTHISVALDTSPLPYADKVMKCIQTSKRVAGNNGYCSRAVRTIFNCTKLFKSGSTTSHAKDSYQAYMKPSEGFVNDPKACKRPGVLLIYSGAKVPTPKGLPACKRNQGFISGHIETIGTDGKYYHFNRVGSPEPINVVMGGDHCRKLTHCLVKASAMKGGG